MAKDGAPSYVELVACLEMMRDSRAHREEERSNNVGSRIEVVRAGRL
jgi:hypothetical protein